MPPVSHELVTLYAPGKGRRHELSFERELEVGEVVFLAGRHWLVGAVEPGRAGAPARVTAQPARYCVVLTHPDGRREAGALRRFRTGGPRLGHAFSTMVDGEQASWQIVDERPAIDFEGQPYLELVAERNHGELDGLPDHELEHVLAGAREVEAPPSEPGRLAAGTMELVALEADEAPDWEAAERYIDALVLDEIGEDVRILCGVDPRADPPEGWLATVKGRLRADLEQLRADLEGDRGEIERWDEPGVRVFVSVGTWADESDPKRAHGWMCRLADSGVLGAARFERVRKADL